MNGTPMQPVHFLLVDDLEENLLALEALLRRESLVLLKARNGNDALEMLLRYDVALALVDVQMPGMDGFELAELMRGTERTRRVPIIFLTAGTADRRRRFRGYEAGAVDFLHKPLEPDILRGKAEVFFDLYRQRQEVARQRDELKAATEENARLLKESRQYAKALEEADQRKDDFIALLAHELRNPLAPIRNGLQVMRIAAGNPAAVSQARDMMDRQLLHMVRLVDDLLDVSRITRNKMDLRRAPVLLADVVNSAIESARPLIDAAKHELTVSLPPEAVYLNADMTRLAQVLNNLLTNSAKYTEQGGHIWFTAEREEDHVVLAVRDDGIGIPAESLPTIFDMFSQVDRTIERSSGGLGIGLALVKGLVEMHGGTVEASSPGPGKGSTLKVRLPILAHHEATVANAEAGTPGAVAGARRILVVDDNVDSATSMALILRLSGNEVWTACDGLEAVNAVEQFRPDVILMDVGMPRLNGYEATRRIRQLPAGQSPIIVALTGWGQEADKLQSREAGCDGHLVKPVDLEALEKLVVEVRQSREPAGSP